VQTKENEGSEFIIELPLKIIQNIIIRVTNCSLIPLKPTKINTLHFLYRKIN